MIYNAEKEIKERMAILGSKTLVPVYTSYMFYTESGQKVSAHTLNEMCEQVRDQKRRLWIGRSK